MSERVAEQVREARIATVCVNNTFRLAPWADMLYAADVEWWGANPDAMQFAGLKISVASLKGVHMLKNSGVTGFDPDPSCVRTGGNSGFQAINIAAHTGSSRILLCGFDMHGGHWHAPHKAPLRETTPEVFTRWLGRFPALADALAKRGIDVVNVTPNSALGCFRRSTLEDELSTSTVS